MLYWAAVFLCIALFAGVIGFGTVAVATPTVAQILFFVFLALFLVSLLVALLGGRRRRS